MNADQLRERFPDDSACRQFFESIIWKNGRVCPHCVCEKSYPIRGKTSRPGLYECDECKRQFTVTTRTPLHSTKLPLWKWLQMMYYMVNSSKGVSSVFMGQWIGVAQKTAWKMGHAIREMMDPGPEGQPPLTALRTTFSAVQCPSAGMWQWLGPMVTTTTASIRVQPMFSAGMAATGWKSKNFLPLAGIVELDEKYVGGKPRYEKGIKHKRGKGTEKQGVLVAVERHGPCTFGFD